VLLKVAPLAQADQERPALRAAAWATFRFAIEQGWGATTRLCLLMIVSFGVPSYGLARLGGELLARIH
jgi:hypothetical protein